MQITLREMMTAIHGMLFGGFFLLALFGAFVLLLEQKRYGSIAVHSAPEAAAEAIPPGERFYLVATAALGWAAVLTGAYVIYPWYRAVAPAGADITLYPKFLLTAHPATAGWHTFGMEWKEHVAWIAPMAATVVAFVRIRHRAVWNESPQVRNTVVGFAAAAFLSAAIAGGWGAMINKKAPVQGGETYQLLGDAK